MRVWLPRLFFPYATKCSVSPNDVDYEEMVRETRYLLVRNLPEKVSEEEITNHFQRYGKIQSVKQNKDSDGGVSFTVAFMDIKSASKAHMADNQLETGGPKLLTEYCEASSSRGSLLTRTHELDARQAAPSPYHGSSTTGTSRPASAASSSTFSWSKGGFYLA